MKSGEGSCVHTTYRLTLEEAPAQDVERFVRERLGEYNEARVGPINHSRLAAILRDAEGAIAGGLLADIYWGWLAIEILWVRDDLRGQGYGRALVQAVEQEAVRRGCRGAHVDTMSFQARPFYEKLGYTVFGELSDVPPGHTRYWLKKRLP